MVRDFLKRVLLRWIFPPGVTRRVLWGPLCGMVWRVNFITGVAPIYSGVERPVQAAMHRFVKSGSCVLDVGSNWGLHTLLLSRLAGAQGRVLAFEPVPEVFAELQWHLAANNCQNVTAIRCALAEREGEQMFSRGATAAEGSLDQGIAGSEPAGGGFVVPVKTVDGMVDQYAMGRVDFIKIDVEGAESRVLEGATKTIERYRPRLIIELHNPDQDVAVAAFLCRRGFRLSRVSGPPITRFDRGWPDEKGVWGRIIAEP